MLRLYGPHDKANPSAAEDTSLNDFVWHDRGRAYPAPEMVLSYYRKRDISIT
jgi:hypothetical protein